jgi:hypothetical protein
MENVTAELLLTIYNRAKEFAITKYGKEPDEIHIEPGNIEVLYENYCCGSSDWDYHTITAEDLSADLDKVAEERRQLEEKERLEKEEKRKIEEQKRLEREKEIRRASFLRLKKEFGDEL